MNIQTLMNEISDCDKLSDRLWGFLSSRIYSVSTRELDGTKNVMSNYYDEYQKVLKEYEDNLSKLTKLKTILYEKNNTFKLSDGRSIQSAIIDNSNLRKLKSTYEELLIYVDTTRRIDEANSSYFEVNTINYDRSVIEKELASIVKKIQETDLEISKLNSIEFIID